MEKIQCYYKVGRVWSMDYEKNPVLLKSGQVWYMHYKEGPVLLQSGAGLMHAL